MKKILRMIVLLGLTSIAFFSLFRIEDLKFALSNSSSLTREQLIIYEDGTFILFGEGTKKDGQIYWKVEYERKEALEENKLSFLLMNQDIILGKDAISEETQENFHYIKPFWQEKEGSLKVNKSISFQTPDEEGWTIKIHDGSAKLPVPDYQEFKTILLPYNRVVDENKPDKETEGANDESSENEDSSDEEYEPTENSSEEDLIDFIEDNEEQSKVDAVTGVTKGEDELAPQNAILINDIFDVMRSEPANPAPFYSNLSKKNYYTGLQSFSEFGPNDPRKNRVYYLAGNNNRMSVFSKENYRLDFRKPFQGMVYISLGVNEADGMTFTLHNDSRKSGASGPLSTSGQGGALGVYAKDVQGLVVWKELDLDSTIRNSISVEFDMHYNDGGKAAPLDADVYEKKRFKAPHVAQTNPGNDEGYQYVSGIVHDYRVIHNNPINTTIYDKIGYKNQVKEPKDPDNPVEINWNELEFSYDDFDGDGKTELIFDLYLPSKKGRKKIWSQKVDYKDLKDRLKIEENGFKAYWGFTAANGSNSGMDGFAVAKIPLNFSVENKVYRNYDTDITLDNSQSNKEEKHATEEDEIRLAGRVASGDGQGNVTEGILELDSINMMWDKEVLPLKKITQLKIQKLDSLTNTVINEIVYSQEELTENIWQDNQDGSGKNIPLTNPFNSLSESEHLWAVLAFENGIINEGNVDRDGFQVSQFQMQAKTKANVTQSGPPAYFAVKMFGEAELLIVPNFLFGNEDGKTSVSYLHENKSIPLNRVRPTAGIERNRDYYFPIDFYLLDRRSLADKEANPLTINTKFDFYSNNGGLTTYTPEMKLKYRKKEDSVSEESIIDDNQNILINQENTQIAIVEANTKRIELDFHTYLDEGILDFRNTLLPHAVGLYEATITWSLENVPKP